MAKPEMREILLMLALIVMSSGVMAGYGLEIKKTQPEAPIGETATIELICLNFELDDKFAEIACRNELLAADLLPESDPRYRAAINGLSVRTSNIDEQEKLTVKYISLMSKYEPSNYRDITGAMGALGGVLVKQGRLDEAFSTYGKAIRYGLENLGEYDIEVAAIRLFVGNAYLKAGKTEEAKEHFLACYHGALYSDSPHIKTVVNIVSRCERHLADAYRTQNRHWDALRHKPINYELDTSE